MNAFSKLNSLCIPCSTQHHAWRDFFSLKGKERALIGTITGIITILSLPIFGLLGVLTFRCLVKKFSAKKIIISNALDKKIETQNSVHLSNKTEQRCPTLLSQPIQSVIKLKKVSTESFPEVEQNVTNENQSNLPLKSEENLPTPSVNFSEFLMEKTVKKKKTNAFENDPRESVDPKKHNLSTQSSKPAIDSEEDLLTDNEISENAFDTLEEKNNLDFNLSKEEVSEIDLSNPKAEIFYDKYELVDLVKNIDDALHKKDIEAAYQALQKIINVNAQTEDKQTILHLAAEYALYDQTIKFLLDRGADANLLDCNGFSPLYNALKREHWTIAEALVIKTQDTTKELYTALWNRRSHDSNVPLELIQALIPKVSDINHEFEEGTLLYMDVLLGDYEVVNLLLNHGADPNVLNALHHALPRPRIVELLLNHGVNIQVKDSNGEFALSLALKNGYSESLAVIATKLNENITSRQEALQFSLQGMVKAGNIQAVRDILKAGENINSQDNNLWTALHYAVKENNFEMVEFLLRQGADTHILDFCGRIPLHLAVAWECNLEIIKLLAESSNMNAQDSKKRTPLSLAVKMNNYKMVKTLLECGADPDTANQDENLPKNFLLHSHLSIYELLCRYREKRDNHEENLEDRDSYSSSDDDTKFIDNQRVDLAFTEDSPYSPDLF